MKLFWPFHFLLLFVLLITGTSTISLGALDGSGLQISVAGDMAGSFGNEGANGAINRLDAREAEFMFYAPTDHLFNAALSFAAHYEAGLLNAELHELYIESTKLIPRSRLKLGQYFLGFGRLNQFHRHDWPFTTTPKIHSTLFDAEAVMDTGIQYGYLLPLPIYLDLVVGITNGWNFGHSHTQGNKPAIPTHYARLSTYQTLPGNGGLQAGFNYVGRRTQQRVHMSIFGLDLVAKWRKNQYLTWLFQGELWYRTTFPEGGYATRDWGFYFYTQYNISGPVYLGVRLDYYTQLDLFDAITSARIKNAYLGLEPVLTYKPSEFSTFRLSYSYRNRDEAGTSVEKIHMFVLQAAFIIGAHPAHDF